MAAVAAGAGTAREVVRAHLRLHLRAGPVRALLRLGAVDRAAHTKTTSPEWKRIAAAGARTRTPAFGRRMDDLARWEEPLAAHRLRGCLGRTTPSAAHRTIAGAFS